MWIIEYTNDVTEDDAFSEWWIITNGEIAFQTDSEDHARWLCEIINKHDKQPL